MSSAEFRPANIGRGTNLTLETRIRSDQIAWINDSTVAGMAWMAWIAELQNYLNAHLFLGLFSFESHFAHYKPGCFYGRHQDAFHGDANRILSLIVYLNPDWQSDDAGELALYTGESTEQPLLVHPQLSTLVIFLSEDIEHEVLVTNAHRRSVAGWFHVNQSIGGIINPPS